MREIILIIIVSMDFLFNVLKKNNIILCMYVNKLSVVQMICPIINDFGNVENIRQILIS